jgi:hypothetical protein
LFDCLNAIFTYLVTIYQRAEISRANLSPATTDSDDEVIMDIAADANPAAA